MSAPRSICRTGSGALVTFGIKGGYEAGRKLIDSVKLFSHVANIGDAKSLIIHPSSTTHQQLSEAGATGHRRDPELVRLSVGIEDVRDIIGDLAQAIEAANGTTHTLPEPAGHGSRKIVMAAEMATIHHTAIFI